MGNNTVINMRNYNLLACVFLLISSTVYDYSLAELWRGEAEDYMEYILHQSFFCMPE
ncbi:hypothetical protein [Mucilaginibacter xinganensis]|uniref:Uncharacterized protein n=1 Tax=Mucilaginibacter xinganensis TaxID=1234841 RepID=A0A223NX46_9SPHI|nr:hypothetical protein [Mucilaginibacter xinganensis]ASU34447.1 hypothetical protein MuYL_2560 [Mucilaginibacter xinganensis]